jgi:hypothetical protein
VSLIVDVGAPTLTASSFDLAEGIIRLTFNEELFTFALAPNGVGLQNAANSQRTGRRRNDEDGSGSVFYPFQDATVTQTGRDVTVMLGPDDRAIIAAIPSLGSEPGNTFLVLEGDIGDAFGNKFAGSGREQAQAVGSVTGAPGNDDDEFWEKWYWIASRLLACLRVVSCCSHCFHCV